MHSILALCDIILAQKIFEMIFVSSIFEKMFYSLNCIFVSALVESYDGVHEDVFSFAQLEMCYNSLFILNMVYHIVYSADKG